MKNTLTVSIGQYSCAGVKPINQDALGSTIPKGQQLTTKGIALALADGISSSKVAHIASESAVKAFLQDYFCTSELWSVETAGKRVIQATNSWLTSQSRQALGFHDKDKGYACTFDALIFKQNYVHIFHVGDARIYRINAQGIEQLTKDHRLIVSSQESYLARALGTDEHIDIDYASYPICAGDIFLLMTDGVYEYIDISALKTPLQQACDDLDSLAASIVKSAEQSGSQDNLSLQIVRVDHVAVTPIVNVKDDIESLRLVPTLDSGDVIDGLQIVRKLHSSSRSVAYLAVDTETQCNVVLKTPSTDMAQDPGYLERFLLEEWIARRIHSVNVVKIPSLSHTRTHLYTLTEYIEGQTLQQWITDHPKPELDDVRRILEQIAHGLRAFHRMEMLHQDLKPDNIMIDKHGTVKIIDFGSVLVAGIDDAELNCAQPALLGTALFSAPEYFLGEFGDIYSDQFSLGVIAYHMLCGQYPYGTDVPKATTVSAQRRLRYRTLIHQDRELPRWVDMAIQRAVHINPLKRYDDLSEFIFDLRTPNPRFIRQSKPPLLESHPVAVWQGISALLALLLIASLSTHFGS